MDAPSNRLSRLDGIRFICAAIVMFGHIGPSPGAQLRALIGGQLGELLGSALGIAFNGPAAVVVFFVVSGFVIHYGNKDRLEISPFYARRFLRIVPPALVFVTVYAATKGAPDSWNDTVLWSLICEAVFYALYPALRRIGIAKALALSVVAATVLFALNPEMLGQSHYTALGPWTWVLALPVWLLGALAAEQPIHTSGHLWHRRLGIYALSCAILAARFHAPAPLNSYPLMLSLFAVPVVFWVGLEAHAGSSWPVLDTLGRASYSLYLVHSLVPWSAHPLPYLACVVVGTALLYFGVERPSHRLARAVGRRLTHQARPPLAVAVPDS